MAAAPPPPPQASPEPPNDQPPSQWPPIQWRTMIESLREQQIMRENQHALRQQLLRQATPGVLPSAMVDACGGANDIVIWNGTTTVVTRSADEARRDDRYAEQWREGNDIAQAYRHRYTTVDAVWPGVFSIQTSRLAPEPFPQLPPEEQPHARARRLLERNLTPAELANYDKHGCIMVQSPSLPNVQYRIPSDGGMVMVVRDGIGIVRLCLVTTREFVPADDMTVILKFWVTANEEEYWRTACPQGTIGDYNFDEHGDAAEQNVVAQADRARRWLWNPFISEQSAWPG